MFFSCMRATSHAMVDAHAREDALVAVAVVLVCVVDEELGGVGEELLALLVSRDNGAVARERQTDGLGKAVHRVGGEHA